MQSETRAAGAKHRTFRLRDVSLILLASIPILFFDLGHYGLVNGDEAFYHEVARNMLESGDWLRVEFAGENRFYDTFTHAPLFQWLKLPVMQIAGPGYWSMRLVSAGFALLTALVVYAFGLRLVPPLFALFAALVQLTSYQFVFLHSGRTGEMEPLIACFILLSPFLLARALENGSGFVPQHLCSVALLYLKAALVLIPLLATVLFFMTSPKHRPRARAWFRDGLWVLPLALAWHGYQIAVGWEPFMVTLETMGRQASGHTGLIETFWVNSNYYLQTLAWGGFPYALLYPVAATVFLFPGGERERGHEWRMLGCYVLMVWVFFALVALAHPWYIIPLYGFAALAVSGWLHRFEVGELPRVSASLGVGLLAAAPWLRLEWLGFDPFSKPAISVNPTLEWVGCMGLPAWLVVSATLLTVSAIAWRLEILAERNQRYSRGRRTLVVVVAAALLTFGSVRVVSSLVHTDHVSEVEQFSRELAARKATGASLAYPIQLPTAGRFVVDFFFHREYRLRRTGIRRFELVGPRRPGSRGEPTVPSK